MASYRIFVSSTTRDLWQYREVAREVIGRLHESYGKDVPILPVSMDTEMPDGDERHSPLDASRDWVAEADWVVLIVAWNYGYVPPGESCSVTEWEYRQATEVSEPPKKCFVFIAGEESDKPQHYRALDENAEKVNLLSFRGAVEGRPNEAAFDAFKARLRAKRFALFRNIEDFRGKLEKTLTQRIIARTFKKLSPQIPELKQPLNDCFVEVKLLAQFKRLHDRLHKVRQFYIRQWRECVITLWPDNDRMPARSVTTMVLSSIKISGVINEIQGLASDLPDALAHSLPSLAEVKAENLPTDLSDKALFIQATDDFAARVQAAFTGCNAQMNAAAARLDAAYQRMVEKAHEALNSGELDDDRHDLLKMQLGISMQIAVRLKAALSHHNDWQKEHDLFEQIDNGLEHESEHDTDADRERRNAALRRALRNLVISNASAVRALLQTAGAICEGENQERLKVWPPLISKVTSSLDGLVAAPDVEAYQRMRTAFDDLFFQIDMETLKTVETSEGRVQAMENGLRGIEDAITVPAAL